MENVRKVLAIFGALVAMGIAIPFTVLYANQYHQLRNFPVQCTASQAFGNSTSQIDVTERYTMVLKYGFIYYLLCSIFLIFSLLSVLHPVIGSLTALFQVCCVSPVGTAQVIVVGVYRFSWSGSACSYPGAPLETQGTFLKNMFIAQLCLNGLYICFASCGQRLGKGN